VVKILSKSGDSLADVYDVQGSIAGIDNLESKEVQLVHEMGATIFSERLSSSMVAISSGAVDQSLEWDVSVGFNQNSRVLGIAVVSSNEGRLTNATVSIRSGVSIDNMEVPIWAWDAGGGVVAARVLVGGSLTNRNLLISEMVPIVPNFLVGPDSPRPADILQFRGGTTAFGAGAVTTQLLVYLAFPQTGGLSSRGLPIPSW